MIINADAIFEKLRAQNQHAEGITFKMKDDSRITKIGKYLSKFSDELSQFANVFIGDMSLSGTRSWLWCDLKILVKTVPAVLFAKGAN
jgi:lipopolysaccharide/colanic/teichoic acid biosynthesis glycosyltransferase